MSRILLLLCILPVFLSGCATVSPRHSPERNLQIRFGSDMAGRMEPVAYHVEGDRSFFAKAPNQCAEFYADPETIAALKKRYRLEEPWWPNSGTDAFEKSCGERRDISGYDLFECHLTSVPYAFLLVEREPADPNRIHCLYFVHVP